MSLRYSTETLYHFICECSGSFALSGNTLPETVTCPHCRKVHKKFIQLDSSEHLRFCYHHNIWYYGHTCPMGMPESNLT